MDSSVQWRSGAATHPGRVRAENQDRSYLDDQAGVFLVVDGLGGHAAGERAAETAVNVIEGNLARERGDARDLIRGAIREANNRIYELSQDNDDCRGMACVLTLAVISGDRVVVGHVGDSRLYLVWNGSIRKLTSDHSPVGEREDRGELTEQEAMEHPRRHEVFRNVGSRRHEPDDSDFIEIKEFLWKPDAAMLLCSDGLSDSLTSAQMLEILDRYDGDAERVASDLVKAANEMGGMDNITAVFVAGREFIGPACAEMREARARHSITRTKNISLDAASGTLVRVLSALTGRTAFLIYGFVLGVVLALAWR